MKAFDPASIYERLVDKLSQNPDWKAVIGDSVVSSILKATSEVNAETARYAEHLYKESRWDTAQNTSSIVAAAGQLGYKPARKRSAFGEIYISADPRTHLVGRSIFKDTFLDLKNISEGGSTNSLKSSWKTPGTNIPFSRNVTITDSKGNNYIMTSLNPLGGASEYSFQLGSSSSYTRNTIIQGTRKTIEIPVDIARTIATRSKLDPYIFIPVTIPNCEDANNVLTRSFFRVFVVHETASGGESRGSRQEYRVVDTLHLSDATDRDVEVYNDLYDKDVMYLKFNASSVRGRVLNLSEGTGVKAIEIDYVESLGQAGNVPSAYEQFTITGLSGEHAGEKLYGINLDPIVGGANEESIYDIKERAPAYYMNTYTVATKEAYENILRRIDFDGSYASKVRVFAKTSEDTDTEIKQRITWVTMLLPSLEDQMGSTEDNPYAKYERLINYYLAELKAPTDVIRFTPPRYEGFGIGINCTADRSMVDNLAILKNSMRDTLDEMYGARSEKLDFTRPVYSSDIISTLKNKYPALRSVKAELEAVTKLNWNDTLRIQPVENQANPIRTLRIPFTFNSLFEGGEYKKGFKDHRTGASYVLRIDIFYKQSPDAPLPPYHTSIFIKEDPTRKNKSFFYKKDGAENVVIWPEDGVVETANYPFTPDKEDVYDRLEEGYQFYFKKKYFTDPEFDELVSDDALSSSTTLSTYKQTPGALDSFVVWWGDNVDDTEDDSGDGYFEFDIVPLYYTLRTIGEQHPYLIEALSQYDLAQLRCDASDETVLAGFVKNVLANYVDIYISRRPIDTDLVFINPEKNNNVVLYVDSQDQLGAGGKVSEESQSRRARLLSVECDLI